MATGETELTPEDIRAVRYCIRRVGEIGAATFWLEQLKSPTFDGERWSWIVRHEIAERAGTDLDTPELASVTPTPSTTRATSTPSVSTPTPSTTRATSTPSPRFTDDGPTVPPDRKTASAGRD